MACGKQGLDAMVRCRQQGCDRRRHPHMGDQQGKVGQSQGLGLENSQSRCGSRGLEAHGKEHHLVLRLALGKAHGVDG